MKYRCFPDGVTKVMTQYRDLSDKQLLIVSKQLGKEWKEVAIFLDFTLKELEDIQAAEKDVSMQKLKVLVEWTKKAGRGKATAYHLWKSVEKLDVLSQEFYQTLQGKTQLPQTKLIHDHL